MREIIFEELEGHVLSLIDTYGFQARITVTSALSDAQVHPLYLGNTIVVIRTYPIRVGHILTDGKVESDSGPFYSDSAELTWEDLGIPPEYTTNTKRVRRVASFSFDQYNRMVDILRPNYLFLNFANYLSKEELNNLLNKLPHVTHVCYGPKSPSNPL